MNQSLRHALSLVGLAVMTIASPAFAIVTSDEAGSHVVTPGEPMFGVNLDGVAVLVFQAREEFPDFGEDLGEFIQLCSGALISDRHVLSAAHCFDINEDGRVDSDFLLTPPFQVHAAFDLAEVRTSIAIENVRIVKNWSTSLGDIGVAILSEDAPANVPRYPLYGGRDELGQQIVRAGYGMPGHGDEPITEEGFEEIALLEIGGVKRAGLNRFEALGEDLDNTDGRLDPELPDVIPVGAMLVSDFDSLLPEHNGLATLGFASDLGFGDDEVSPVFGDSGGPVFLDGAIVGITSFGAASPATRDDVEFPEMLWGALALDIRVSSFQEFILAATDGEARFVDNLPGDYNGNGAVEQADLDLVLLNWGNDPADVPTSWIRELPEGMVDENELDRVLMNWGNRADSGTARGAGAVPEPGAMWLAVVLATATLIRRQRSVVTRATD